MSSVMSGIRHKVGFLSSVAHVSGLIMFKDIFKKLLRNSMSFSDLRSTGTYRGSARKCTVMKFPALRESRQWAQHPVLRGGTAGDVFHVSH